MYKVIYLQVDEDIEFDDEATWCHEQINDDDIKYILADSRAEAADDLFEALKELLDVVTDTTAWSCRRGDNGIQKAVAALVKAEGNEYEGKS